MRDPYLADYDISSHCLVTYGSITHDVSGYGISYHGPITYDVSDHGPASHGVFDYCASTHGVFDHDVGRLDPSFGSQVHIDFLNDYKSSQRCGSIGKGHSDAHSPWVDFSSDKD